MDYPQHCDDAVAVGGRSKYTFDAFGDEVVENQGFSLKLTFVYDADACLSGAFDISSATAALYVAPYGDSGYSPVSIGGTPALSDSGSGTTDTVTFTVTAGSLPTDISENYAVNSQGNAVFTVVLTQGTKVITFTERTNLIDPYQGLTNTTTPSAIATQRNDLGNVISLALTTPPVSPNFGDAYIPAATATGAWAGLENYLVVWNGTEWLSTLPTEGNYVYDENLNVRNEYIGASWVVGFLNNIVEDVTPQLGGNLDANGFNIAGVTPTEMSYLSGITSAVQTQINTKLANIVEDTTPQLGGNLDMNTYKRVNTGGDIVDKLGDNGGLYAYNITDSDDVVVFAVDSDGAITGGTFNGLQISSSRYANISLPAVAFTPAVTNGAQFYQAESTTNKVNYDFLLFDASTEEYACINFPMPDDWNLGTIKAKFFWRAGATVGSGDVIWGIQGVAISNDDAIDTAYGTAQEVTDTYLTSGDIMVTSATGAITIAGTPALGDIIQFRIYRKAADGSDTYTQDAGLVAVQIQYAKLTTEPVIW